MRHHCALRGCKIIGLVLFLWILGHIGWKDVLKELQDIEKGLLILSFVPLVLQYVIRTVRWHLLVRTTGLRPTFMDSWKLFNIGAFLAMITPAKIGELGRAAELHRQGMYGPTALAVSLVDRIADTVVIGAIATLGIHTLFGTTVMLAVLLVGIVILITTVLLWKVTKKHHDNVKWLREISAMTMGRMLLLLLITTTMGWMCYFWWAVLLSESLNIVVTPMPLIAVLTLTGIVSILPIAPSGLGTRDMALITLLAPYGIAAPRAVALASLMFLTPALWSSLGAWYWLKMKA